MDWSGSPLGAPAAWPPALRAQAQLVFEAGVPMVLAWGPRRALLYNAAWAALLGERHPWALGRSLLEVGPAAWPEQWPALAGAIEGACAGAASRLENLTLPEARDEPGPASFTLHLSPLRDEHGVPAGMCGMAVETNARPGKDTQPGDAYLQSLFGHSAAGIVESDLAFRVLRANPTFCDIVGRSADEIAGHPLEGLIHPDDLARHTVLLERMLASKQPFEIENRYLRPDGSEVWAAKMVAPILDPGTGRPASIFAIVVDTTRRRQAEALLRENAERLRLATEAARLGIWSWNVSDDNPYWENDRLYEMVGLARGAAEVDTVRLLTQLVHPDDIAPYQAAMAHTLATGEPFRYEGRFYRASDGALRWFEFTGALHCDAAGKPLRMVGTAADVTERKEMHERLRLREERYRTLLEAIDEGYCVVELLFDGSGAAVDHRFLEANPAFGRHTGLGEVVGKCARDLAPAIEPLWTELYARVAASGEPARTVQYSAALDRWFDVFVARPEGTGRNRVAVVFRDITETRRAEEELRKLAADLSKANGRQNEFLATLAHELRNPLAPIKTGLDLMRLSPANAAATNKVRDMMERQVNHLIHLVNDLLDLARVQSGKVELKKAHVVLQDIVAAAVETALPLIEARGHAFEQHLPPTPLILHADANRLAQVIGNLLTNAAKYTPNGGHILLELTREPAAGDVPEPDMEAGAVDATGATALVRVSDNGIGIPADALPKLFDMFHQGRNGLEYAQGGLGIGLNLVKRLTAKHGGSVSAASAGPGMGSCFTLRLPLAVDGMAAARATDAVGARVPGNGLLHILVADDNHDAAALLTQLLEAQGHRVRTVHDGKAAFEAACAAPPDLALLDIGMPGMTGYEVARALRRLEPLTRTVLVAVTGWGAQEDRKRSREAGFDRHLTKPVDLESLNGLIAEVEARAAASGRDAAADGPADGAARTASPR